MKNTKTDSAIAGAILGPATDYEQVCLLENDEIAILDLKFRSPAAYQFLADAGDKVLACIRLIEVGAAALCRVESTMDSDYIEKRLYESFQNLEHSIASALDPLNNGSIANKINVVFETQNSNVKELLCTNLKSDAELEKKLLEFTCGLKDQVFGALEKQTTEGGLGALLGQLRNSISELQNSILVSKTEKESSAPLIGKSFEESCQTVLEAFCKAHGCVLDDLRTAQGIGFSKKGDYRISRHDIEPVVLEMKGHSSSLSLSACLSELEESIQNRNCAIAILVGAANALPAETGVFNEYGANGNRIICNYEVLEITLKVALAKAKILAANNTTTSLM